MGWLRRWDEQQQRVHEWQSDPDQFEAPGPVSGWRRHLLTVLAIAAFALVFAARWFRYSDVDVPAWAIAAAAACGRPPLPVTARATRVCERGSTTSAATAGLSAVVPTKDIAKRAAASSQRLSSGERSVTRLPAMCPARPRVRQESRGSHRPPRSSCIRRRNARRRRHRGP